MGIFLDKTAEAKTSTRNPYMLEGTYDYQILSCKEGVSEEGIGYFAADLLIKASTNPERPVGTVVGFVQTAKVKSAPSNTKAFIVAALGGTGEDDDLTKEDLEAVVSEKQPLAGVVVKCISTLVEKKQKKGEFYPRHSWSPAASKKAA